MTGVVAGSGAVVACSAAVVDAGRRVGRRLYGDDWAAVVLVAATVASAAVVVALELLGTLGWLSAGGMVLASAGFWLVVWRLPRRDRAEPGGDGPGWEWTPLSRMAALAAAGLLALVAVAVVDGLLEPRYQFDALDYHLPTAVRWLQAGNTRLLPYVLPSGHFAAYPSNFELLELWLLVPLHRDFLVQLASLPSLVMSGFGVARLATTLGARVPAAVAAGLLVVTLPPVLLTQVGTNLNDLFMAGALIAAAAFVAVYTRRERKADLVLAGLALGLGVGTKYQALLAGLPIAALALAEIARHKGRRIRGAALLAVPVLATGAYFYARNAATLHNPVYPLAWSVPGHRFAGASNAACCIGPSWISFGWHPGTWRHAAWEILFTNRSQPQVLRSWGPMVAVLLVAGLCVPLVSLRKRRRNQGLGWWALLPVAEFVVYLATPLSAGFGATFGLINVRYCLVAVMASAAVAAAALGRVEPRREQRLVAVGLVTGLGLTVAWSSGLAPRPAVPLAAGLAVGLVACAVLLGRAVRRRPGRSVTALGAAACVALVGLSPLLNSHYQRTRASLPYQLEADRLPPAGKPVDLVGICELYALYGPHLDRPVMYLTGSDRTDGPVATTYRAWSRQLRLRHVAAVVVDDRPNPCFPTQPQPQANWMAERPTRFLLVFRGPDAAVYRVR